MKDLIKGALDDAYDILQKKVPETKIQIKSMSILDVKPVDLIKFMRDNNIPDSAYFNSDDDETFLSWDIERAITEEEKIVFERYHFGFLAFKAVYRLLTEDGYKKVIAKSSSLTKFKGTTTYDMYITQNFDMLAEYYSLYFEKTGGVT